MFVFAVISFLVALIGFGVMVLDKVVGKVVIGCGLVVGVLALLIASISTVPTQNVGIVTSFSKPTGRTTGAGLKWHAPWHAIDDWDASRQMYDRGGENCLWVNIAAQRRACIPLQVEYASKSERADDNWAAYRPLPDMTRFQTFVHRRVSPSIDAQLVSLFASFDPLGSQVVPKKGEPDPPAPDLNTLFRAKMTEAITRELGEDITVKSVRFGTPSYDKKTQDQVDNYGQKILEGRNLAIDEENAITRARITNTDAKVDQVARCLQIAEKLGKEPGLCMTPATVTRPVS